MRIVLDSNILFSALIKDSFVRRIILEYEGKFLFPSFVFEELVEHKDELMSKSGLNSDEFDSLLDTILRKVEIVHSSALEMHKKRSFEIMKDIDKNDVLFVACALAYPESVIWSDDKHLKKQKEIEVRTTNEIKSILS
ncbi:MAG TPA: PIN domain-containing protein [Candidatus Nanoarchaeia archaeon]|nr:PIN domain-containing protein [Candidatus Nanoarchaeia archaeon]